MKLAHPEHAEPKDASRRRPLKPVICYPVDRLQSPDIASILAVCVILPSMPIGETRVLPVTTSEYGEYPYAWTLSVI